MSNSTMNPTRNYPEGEVDPSRSFACNGQDVRLWLKTRNVREHGIVPERHRNCMEPWITVRVAPWFTKQDSEHWKACEVLCYKHRQREFLAALRESIQHLQRQESILLQSISTSNLDAEILDIGRTILFGSIICARASRLHLCSPSVWPVLYNSFLEMARSDWWKKTNIEICVDNVWGLPAPSVECTVVEELSGPPCIIVDAVITADLSILKYPPVYRDYIFLDLDRDSPDPSELPWAIAGGLRVPILMLEHVKTGPDVSDGLERHRNHLLVIMSTAIAFSAFLKIDLPMFGFLIERTRVMVYMGWIDESEEDSTSTPSPRPPGMCYKLLIELDVYRNPIDALRLRQMTANILEQSKKVRKACQDSSERVEEELKQGTFCRWKKMSAMRLIEETFPNPGPRRIESY